MTSLVPMVDSLAKILVLSFVLLGCKSENPTDLQLTDVQYVDRANVALYKKYLPRGLVERNGLAIVFSSSDDLQPRLPDRPMPRSEVYVRLCNNTKVFVGSGTVYHWPWLAANGDANLYQYAVLIDASGISKDLRYHEDPRLNIDIPFDFHILPQPVCLVMPGTFLESRGSNEVRVEAETITQALQKIPLVLPSMTTIDGFD